jgi:hypothetical protein
MYSLVYVYPLITDSISYRCTFLLDYVGQSLRYRNIFFKCHFSLKREYPKTQTRITTMAAAIAFRNALQVLGFSAPAATYITGTEDIDDMEELEILGDTDVHHLCDSVRNPGGLIANPNAGVAGQAAQIRNPGIPVSTRAETNLKQAAYYLRHQHRIGRTAEAASLTLCRVLRP